jgi:two-component system sensor histidine kinase YesM
MDEQAVDALNKKLLAAGASVRPEAEPSGGMGTVGSFSGLGLANVAERMKLLRGERFSMTVESIPDQGTTIRLMIADERADEDV